MRMSVLKKGVKKAVAFTAALSLAVTSNSFGMAGRGYAEAAENLIKLSDDDVNNLYKEVSSRRQSVHDPSIVPDGNGSYHVFGTMMGVAKTDDLVNWDAVIMDEDDNSKSLYNKPFAEAFTDNALKGNTTYYDSAGQAHTVNFGTYNINNWISGNTIKGNQWAPDVIYNTEMGKWCMYLSLNGPTWNSAIVLLTADDIEGPYTYQAPIVFSGFQTSNNSKTGGFHNTDLELAIGSQNSLPARYDKGGDWGKLWPHAIDPAVFYDDNGNLWMSYGSWSGGIYMLQLDEKTGLRDYSVKYESNFDTLQGNVTSDAYFGKKIAGGHYVSGEASYIEKIGDKYVLFMSYGFMLAETGGYEMRIFYSDNPDGPNIDTKGESAIYDKAMQNYAVGSRTTRGQKLLGNYQWETMKIGENTQGHNSAYYDEKTGRAYVVYHTRFNDGTEGHQLRVHELFLNQDGYIVASPYEYSADNAKVTASTSYPESGIIGTYDVIVHKYDTKCNQYGGETEIVKPVKVTLNADGTVSGGMSGNWAVVNGTPYATITLGGKEYKGVFAEQNVTGTNVNTMCFTVIDKTTGLCAWGSREIADDAAVAQNVKNFKVSISSETYNDIELPTESFAGATITWSSSDTDVISNNGVVTIPADDTEVILTVRISKGDYYYEREYTTTVMGEGTPVDTTSGLEALYKFEGNLTNEVDSSQTGQLLGNGAAQIPGYEYNPDMGSKILHQYFGAGGSESYAKFTNPLQGKELDGATVSLWVNCPGENRFDAIWSFLDNDKSDGIDGRLFFTPNTYLGFNGTGGWFDCNHGDTATNAISANKWHLVTVSMGSSNFSICIDGVKRYDKNTANTWNSFESKTYDDMGRSLLNLLSSAQDFYLGYGSFWGSADVLMDSLRIYSRALTEADIAQLYNEELAEIEKAKMEGSADTSKFIYYNDYNNSAGISDTGWQSVTAQAMLSLATDITGDKKLYVNFAPGNVNSRSAYNSFGIGNKLDGTDEYTVSFDTKLPVGNNQQSQLALTSSGYNYSGNDVINGNYIWSMNNNAGNSTNWTINDDSNTVVNIPKDTWVNITTKISGSTDVSDEPFVPNDPSDESLKDGLIAEYLFNGNLNDSKDKTKQVEIIAADNGNTSKIVKDSDRGNVMEMRGTWQATGYLKLDNSYLNEINDAFTVTMWAKANNSKTDEPSQTDALNKNKCGPGQSIFNFKTTSDSAKPDNSHAMGFVSLDVSFNPFINDGKGNWNDRENDAVALSSSNWQQVTMSIDGTNNKIYIYVDGQLSKTVDGLGGGTCADLLASIKENTTEIQIGTFLPWWNAWDFRGYVDDVRLYNRVLTADEVSKLYAVEGNKSVAAMQSQGDSGSSAMPAKADVTITNIDTGAELYSGSINNLSSTIVDGIYVLNGRYQSVSSFDNIKVYSGDVTSVYDIVFDANGGEGSMDNMLACNIVQNYRLSANKFKKDGYTFAGWGVTPDGDVQYQDEDIVSGLSSENGGIVTLYAVWLPNYTITFDGNAPDGAEVTGSMRDMSCVTGTEYTLYSNSFKCEGYTFAGWATENNAVSATYANKAKVKNLTDKAGSIVILYAVWTKGDTPVNPDDASLKEGLMAEYLFDGNLIDSKNPSKQAEIIGEEDDNKPVIVKDASRGNVMEMRGTWQATGYIKIDKSYVNNINNVFTVTMWAKANNSKTGEDGICGKNTSIFNFKTTPDSWQEGTDAYKPGFVSLDASLHPWINDFAENNNWVDRKDEEINLSSSKWQQVTMSIDGSSDKIYVYVDGKLAETVNGLGGGTCASLIESIKQNTTEIQIGTFLPWWNAWDFRGYVDDIRFYDRLLTDEEIAKLYSRAGDSSIAESETAEPTETPSGTTKPSQPTQKPSDPGNSGGNSSGGGFGGGYQPSVTAAPTVKPTATPKVTATPKATIAPTAKPVVTPTPVPGGSGSSGEVTNPLPTVTPNVPDDNNNNQDNNKDSGKKVKKGTAFTNNKTKAVYKVINTGTNAKVEYIGSKASKATKIAIPKKVTYNGVKYKVTSIGKKAFAGNKKLKEVTISKNVTSINDKAFSNCKKLSLVKISSNVKKIGKKAFYGCKNLRYIRIESNNLKLSDIGKNAFAGGYKTPRVKVKKNKVKLYKDILLKKGLSSKAVFVTGSAKLVK